MVQDREPRWRPVDSLSFRCKAKSGETKEGGVHKATYWKERLAGREN